MLRFSCLGLLSVGAAGVYHYVFVLVYSLKASPVPYTEGQIQGPTHAKQGLSC